MTIRVDRRLGRSRWAILTALAFLGVALASPAQANLALLQVSSDPYTNAGSQHRTEVEPDTFAHGATIVSAFQVGRIFSGGAANIGFSTSTNGGSSWTQGFLPSTTSVATPAGPYAAVSDPSVAYDAKHGVWLISYLGLAPGTGRVDVLASRSTDGGLTWGTPIVVNGSGDFNDKNWTVCDDTATSPFYGNCYTEFDDNTQGDLVLMSTSTDGGLSWGPALSTASGLHGIGGQPVVQPDGDVVVPINGFAGRNFLVVSFTSTDGGATWGKTHVVAKVGYRAASGQLRDSIPLTSAETDASGTVYVVWQDCRFEPTCNASDLIMSKSTDGVKWSKLSRLPLDPVGSGVDHFIPGLAVDRTTSGASAHLVVAYYFYPMADCTVDTCQLHVGYSSSVDGGASWTSGTSVAGPMSLTWFPDTSQGRMPGDYVSTSFASGAAFPIVAIANAPTGNTFDVASYTIQGGAVPTGPTLAVRDRAPSGATVKLTRSNITSQ
jgi:hypothetical protein